jgi:flavin reductase (DIM6/NTAB) family NADH-FMN oxidoreductase RutF
MRRLPTGLTIVSATAAGEPVGMLVGTFTSVSLRPLLVGFLGDRASSTLPALLDCEHWGFSVLGEDCIAVVDAFRRPKEQRFTHIAWHPSASGAPLVDGAVVTIEASRYKVGSAGDHCFVTAAVHDVRVRHDDRPLVYFQGGATRLDPSHQASSAYHAVCWQDLR